MFLFSNSFHGKAFHLSVGDSKLLIMQALIFNFKNLHGLI